MTFTVRHGFSMAHRNRWFTELRNGDFPRRIVSHNGSWNTTSAKWCVVQLSSADVMSYAVSSLYQTGGVNCDFIWILHFDLHGIHWDLVIRISLDIVEF
jgi:hypothetical protein